jgi:hypothetical protein
MLVRMHLLGDLFRVGFGCALELKWKAERWQRTAWFFTRGLAIGFWGETGMGVLGGLLLKKPLFYNPAGAGSLYKEFTTLDQIRSTGKILDDIIAYDELLAAVDLDIGRVKGANRPEVLTYQNLLLTLWARHYLGLPDNSALPLTLDQFSQLFSDLWEKEAKSPTIRNDIKDHFMEWLARCSDMERFDIADRMGGALEELFNTVVTELGHVEARYLDPRFVHLFILK